MTFITRPAGRQLHSIAAETPAPAGREAAALLCQLPWLVVVGALLGCGAACWVVVEGAACWVVARMLVVALVALQLVALVALQLVALVALQLLALVACVGVGALVVATGVPWQALNALKP